MKKRMLASLFLVPALLLGACSSQDDSAKTDSNEKKAVTYKVGIDATYPPFEFEEGGKYKGIDIDLMNAIAKDQNFKVEYKPMNFKGIIPALQAKQLDVAIAGMSITDDRKKQVDFSQPYFDAGLTLVVKKDEKTVKSLDQLKGKQIAVKKGTTGATYASKVAAEKGLKVVEFDNSPAMFLDVANGNSTALIEDYPVISYAIAQKDLGLKIVGERLNGDQYGIAVLKGENKDLLKKIDAGLADLKESGEYDKIIKTYLSE